MKKKTIIPFLMICMASVMLTGCGKEETETAEILIEERDMFGLTAAEEKMCAEYAAGVLMKYNSGSNMRILEGQQLVREEEKEQAQQELEEKRKRLAEEYQAQHNSTAKQETTSSSSNSSQSSGNGGNEIQYISDMSEATGTKDFSIRYQGYEVTDSYPKSGEDLLMAIDATQGKILLVLKFSVTNLGSQTEKFDMFSNQAKFRVKLNDKRYTSQYTLLLNDLSMYKGDIEAGSSVDTVLIFEIPETESTEIGEMLLSITTLDEMHSMRLEGSSSEPAEESNPDEETNEILREDVLEIGSQTGNSTQTQDEETEEEYNDLAEEYLNALEAEEEQHF